MKKQIEKFIDQVFLAFPIAMIIAILIIMFTVKECSMGCIIILGLFCIPMLIMLYAQIEDKLNKKKN